MPLHDGAVATGLHKGLVVPEAHWPALEQLACGQADRVVEGNVVEARLAPPVAQAVEKHLPAARRLIVVELVQ